MILPTRTVLEDRCLLVVGAQILELLNDGGRGVSSLWSRLEATRAEAGASRIHFDWFVAALDVLHAIGEVDFDDEHLVRVGTR